MCGRSIKRIEGRLLQANGGTRIHERELLLPEMENTIIAIPTINFRNH